jgi:hypothetical protein
MSAEMAPARSEFSPKDALYALPIFGSALAISWEVGSFIPIGGGSFSVFSLSEHLLFALLALPLALIFACCMLVVVTISRTMMQHRVRRNEARRLSGKTWRLFFRGAVGVIALMGVSSILAGVFIHSLALLVLGVAAISLASAIAISVRVLLWPSRVILAGGCFALLLSLALGFDSTRTLMRSADRFTSNVIGTDGVSRKLLVVRVGERGVLLFDPPNRSFSFAKWDAVKSLEWPQPAILASDNRP